MKRRRYVLLLAALLLLAVQVRAQQGAASVTANGITFFKGTFGEALAKARQENKPLFVDFYAVWCVSFEELYNKYTANGNDLDIQQQLLLKAPTFLQAQEGMEADKWVTRLQKLYKNYIAAKAPVKLINENDYKIILTLEGDEDKEHSMSLTSSTTISTTGRRRSARLRLTMSSRQTTSSPKNWQRTEMRSIRIM